MNRSAERKPCKFAFTDSFFLPCQPVTSSTFRLTFRPRCAWWKNEVPARESERKIRIAILLGRMKKCKCQLNILLIRLCRVLASVFFCPFDRRLRVVRTDSFLRACVFVSLSNARGGGERRILLPEDLIHSSFVVNACGRSRNRDRIDRVQPTRALIVRKRWGP